MTGTQDPNAVGGLGGGPGGGRGGMRSGVMTLQQALSSPDDEWAVLSPKVQRVLDAQQQLAAESNWLSSSYGYGGFGGGYGGRNPTAGGTATIATALAELNAALQDPTQGDDTIRIKLQAYRDAVKTAKNALQNAQGDLRLYVTLRQEAILIGLGYLD